MKMGQKDYRMDDLGQGPIVRAFGQFLNKSNIMERYKK